MSSCSRLLTSVTVGVFFTLLLQPSSCQFPVVCMDDASLQARTCCPNSCGGNRGMCVDFNIPEQNEFNNLTVRNNWPHYFTNLCRCNGNYAGFDCSRCKYGYYGSDCSRMMVLPRRPISDLTTSEWTEYINILIASRTHPSGYFVFLEEPTAGSDVTMLQKTTMVNLYDLFIWQHHYAAKDSENEYSQADYAHESTGFPTWHRQYLLWLEWELQYMLKETRPDTYHTFRLHYWDWRKEMQTDANSPFMDDRLGSTMYSTNGAPIVQGTLRANNWMTRCWMLEAGLICDPNNDTGCLQRCPLTQGMNACRIDNPGWPSIAHVNSAVGMGSYDGGTYDKLSTSGFRNFMEGFNVLSNNDVGRQSCSNDQLCMCEDELPQCNGSQPSQPIARLLHNSVHIILGIGFFGSQLQKNQTGIMGDVAAASSDPIFINHHAMIDCILEEWLQRNDNPQYPQNNQIHRGHRADDYTVPFFPLVTHREMFKTADNFGYTCRLPQIDIPNQPNPSNPPSNRPNPGNTAIKPGPALKLVIIVVLGVGSLFI